MYNILRDTNSNWFLSPRVDARHCHGTPVGDIPRSKRILGRLILDTGNLSSVKSALINSTSGSGAGSALPAGFRAILEAANRRLENGEWVLIEGPARVPRPSVPAKPEAEMIPVDRADWRSADDEPVAAKEPALTIGVEHEVEPVSILECAFAIEPEGGLETGYEIGAPEAPRGGAAEGAS